MNSVESILLSLESKCRMDISAPATKEELSEISKIYPKQFKTINGLYEVTNGVEIDVPGTVLYPIEKILLINDGDLSKDYLKIGVMNFGDTISITPEGKIIQVEHESGDVFLEWDSLEEFLNDELGALE